MKYSRRLWVVLALLSLSLLRSSEVEAAPETILMEDGIEGESISHGILVVENDQKAGSVELKYGDRSEWVNLDYSEYEVPMNEEGTLTVTVYGDCKVDSVSVDGIPLSEKQGVYFWKMDREIMTITVKYREEGHGSEEEKTKPEDWEPGDPRTEENVFSNTNMEQPPSSGSSSVSDITYDVVVTYVNEEEKEDASGQAGSEDVVEKGELEVPSERVSSGAAASSEVYLREEDRSAVRTEDESSKNNRRKKEKKKTKFQADSVKSSKESGGESVKTENQEDSQKLMEKEVPSRKKSFAAFPNLLLYVGIICCIMGLKKILKLDKKG